ncbi:MAG: hypothetical protein JW909_11205 [Planctomycetes bacterium]|nr:hypothetical protein [Planctomycetota bacterium]
MHRLAEMLHFFVSASAATLWAVVLTMAGLSLTGSIPAERWSAIGRVLRGDMVPVDVHEHARLKAAEKTVQARSEDVTFSHLEEAVLETTRLRTGAEQEIAQQKVKLALWQNELTAIQARVNADLTAWRQQKEHIDRLAQEASSRSKSEAEARVLRIYNQMDPSQAAVDLAALYQSGEQGEAGRILAGMIERKAAEVLREVDDPTIRSRLIGEMSQAIAGQPGTAAAEGSVQ